MTVEFGLTQELVNTQYAPLAALFVRYQQKQVFQPLEQAQIQGKVRYFSPTSKLLQLMLSILAGCNTLVEVNTRLGSEVALAKAWGWLRFADQSNLSRMLDQLTLKQIEQLRTACTQIWRTNSQTVGHDWRGYLWLDYDMTGLPCSLRAEASQKGYFSDKKTLLDVSWLASVQSNTEKPSGRMCSRVTTTLSIVYSQRCELQKLL
jgi:hypothetical protein